MGRAPWTRLNASWSVMPSVSIIKAIAQVADRDLPSTQCRKTLPPRRRASRIKADVSPKCFMMFCEGVSVSFMDLYWKCCRMVER